MAFEKLAYRFRIEIPNLPERWLPLIHLYDPDLPLFPIYYFHVLPETLNASRHPSYSQRAFGYIEKINLKDNGAADVTIVVNKDLNNIANAAYLQPVENEIKERLGVTNPVTKADVANAFLSPYHQANAVLSQMWDRVISDTYGDKLPFGRLYDGVWGLARLVASWYSDKGRKGELIQTHYFASKFGIKIKAANGIPQLDFFLLPTIQELTDTSNPLASFPQFANLVHASEDLHSTYCTLIPVAGLQLSRFTNPYSGTLNTEGVKKILMGSRISSLYRPAAMECYNAFNKGIQRPLIFLLMLQDIRTGRLRPAALNSIQCGAICDGLSSTFQSPKVIMIYAQQCFGNPSAIPIDTWIKTMLRWPLNVHPISGNKVQGVLSYSQNLGKVERLLWATAQARKVHSSACNDALWCIKKGSNKEGRGANPLSCNICLKNIRNCCPAYQQIIQKKVFFNSKPSSSNDFEITTSAGNNTAQNQTFVKCMGKSTYKIIEDDFSPADNPTGFEPFPKAPHTGQPLTVDQFINNY